MSIPPDSVALRPYYLAFLIWCIVFTMIFGVLAAIVPQGLGGIFTAIPYLLALVVVVFRFLKREQRAPSKAEHKRLTLGLTLIFWGLNLVGMLLAVYLFSRQDHSVSANFWLYLQQPRFLATALSLWLLLAIPLYVLTYWFWGPQAKRMAAKMFDQAF